MHFPILVSLSCKNKNSEIVITTNLVFSETDTVVTVTNYTQINKMDYFLVKGYLENRQQLKNAIEKFVKQNFNKEYGHYDNHLMFFYRESSEVNEKSLRSEEPQYRYKIFTYSKDKDYIGSFNCWNSKPSKQISFQPKYE